MKKSVVSFLVLLAGCATGSGSFSCGEHYHQCEAGDSRACVALRNCCAGIGKSLDIEHCFNYAFDV